MKKKLDEPKKNHKFFWVPRPKKNGKGGLGCRPPPKKNFGSRRTSRNKYIGLQENLAYIELLFCWQIINPNFLNLCKIRQTGHWHWPFWTVNFFWFGFSHQYLDSGKAFFPKFSKMPTSHVTYQKITFWTEILQSRFFHLQNLAFKFLSHPNTLCIPLSISLLRFLSEP